MKLGFIVNPIAGMGGRVGLKGTNGVLKEAVAKGAKTVAPKRAVEFLQKLKADKGLVPIEILTCPKTMGEEETDEAGFSVQVLRMKIKRETTAEDTKTAARLIIKARADLIVFVGGDGTAKDIFDAMQGFGEIPVLGIPSGVKMYSGIFAVNTTDAVEVVLAFAKNQAEITEFEIMDADETAIRSDSFSVKLHGLLKGPSLPMHVQGSKQVSPETVGEKENQMAIARFVMEEAPADAMLILGPGTTVRTIAGLLGVDKTVLGVDIYGKGKVLLDVDEKKILEEVKDWHNAWIVLSPIGHQGILFGRGNQQISPEIIRHVGKEKMIVVATKNKLQSIDGGVLRVDTGDAETDKMLRGYIKVVTDYKEWRLMPIQ
jgi:predicted polyphosphate/ATP-dependent NAD kinase